MKIYVISRHFRALNPKPNEILPNGLNIELFMNKEEAEQAFKDHHAKCNNPTEIKTRKIAGKLFFVTTKDFEILWSLQARRVK